MFICNECLTKYDAWGPVVSVGPCEECGKVSRCCDIHHGQLSKENPVTPKESGVFFDKNGRRIGEQRWGCWIAGESCPE